jgi:RimJ/RimL family protein N-acetyltransferase
MSKPRRLTPAGAPAFSALRRAAIIESPWAFLGAPGDDTGSDPAVIAERITNPENAIVGIDHETGPSRLVAVAGVFRMPRLKQRHRAGIWGVYCDPAHRGRGHGRAVVQAAIEVARGWPGVKVIGLAVSARSPHVRALYESLGFVYWGTEPDTIEIDGECADDHYLCLRL